MKGDRILMTQKQLQRVQVAGFTVLTTSSLDFHRFKSIRGESWREWGNILICAFTCRGDERRGELEGIWGFEAIGVYGQG